MIELCCESGIMVNIDRCRLLKTMNSILHNILFFVVLFGIAVYSWQGESELLFEVADLHIFEV